jgi:hypothetical protein
MSEYAITLKRGKSVNVSLAFSPSNATPVASGAASGGDNSISIDALNNFIPAGTTVLFSSGATIITSVDALEGTTTLTSDGTNANDLSGAVADNETAVVPSKNFFTSNKQFTARLVLRRKIGNSFNGPVVDTLTTTTTSDPQSDAGRIRFPNIGSTSSLPNIVLYWSGAEATALPNEDVTVFGDLQITDTAVASTEAIHSIRLRFDIKAEII